MSTKFRAFFFFSLLVMSTTVVYAAEYQEGLIYTCGKSTFRAGAASATDDYNLKQKVYFFDEDFSETKYGWYGVSVRENGFTLDLGVGAGTYLNYNLVRDADGAKLIINTVYHGEEPVPQVEFTDARTCTVESVTARFDAIEATEAEGTYRCKESGEEVLIAQFSDNLADREAWNIQIYERGADGYIADSADAPVFFKTKDHAIYEANRMCTNGQWKKDRL